MAHRRVSGGIPLTGRGPHKIIPPTMADIFISYERSNRPHAERIADILQRHGWSVWWDRKILGGEQFSKTIETALTSSRCVIVLWSVTSITSTWVRDEAAAGAERNILVPVVIGDVEIPLGFRQLHGVTLTAPAASEDETTFDDLIAAVEGVMARSGPDTPKTNDPRPVSPPVDKRIVDAATVPRSYLYGALSLIAVLVVILVWRQSSDNTARANGSSADAPRSESSTNPAPSGQAGDAKGPTAQSPIDGSRLRDAQTQATGTPSTAAASGIAGELEKAVAPSGPAAATSETTTSKAESTSVVVTAKGQTFYTVFDEPGTKQLTYAKTSQPVEMLPGNYVVELNGVRRNANVTRGSVTRIAAGTVLLSGTGADFYEIHDSAGKKQLTYAKTNNEIELFAGEYLLTLHGVSTPVVVRAGNATTLAAGRVVVPGSGATFFTVFDAKGEKQISYAKTNQEIELLPGTYTIEMNNIRRPAQIVVGQKTVIDR